MTMNWTEASDLVSQAQHIVVVTHVSPDGDAIGSLMGLTWALRQLDKQVTPAVDGGVPASFAFIPGAEGVQSALNGVQPDLVITVDCGDEARTGQVGEVALNAGVPVINLDHHVSNTCFGQVNLVDPATAAASEGVLDWLPSLGVTLDSRIATCLLTGLVTDTLCFRTDNVTGAVLGKAQQLMNAGAPLSEITQRTVSRKPFAALRLWAQVMPSLQLSSDGVIWAVIDRQARQAAEYTEARDGGLVSLLVSAEEAYIAAVFREKDDGQVEVGFRAVPGFDVAKVAVALGGGGHVLASGCTLPGPLAEAVERTLLLLHKAAEEGSPVVS